MPRRFDSCQAHTPLRRRLEGLGGTIHASRSWAPERLHRSGLDVPSAALPDSVSPFHGVQVTRGETEGAVRRRLL